MTVGVNVPGFIVMAVFRPDPQLLRRQIASIREQTVRDWTCLVGIDGPDSETCSYIADLVTGDQRFEVVEYGENVGHYRNFERLLESVPLEAPWFALSDQDDRWDPDRLALLIDLLNSAVDVKAAMGQALVTEPSGRILGRTMRQPRDLNSLLLKNEVTGSLLVARTSLLPLALPFPDETPAARHDHWLGVVATVMGRIKVSPTPVQEYVQHGRNAVGEMDVSLSARIRTWSQRRGWVRTLHSVATDLWGWRVSMARALLMRAPMMTASDRVTLEAMARGRLSVRLIRYLVSAARSRSIPADIAVGTVVAALWWPVRKELPSAE